MKIPSKVPAKQIEKIESAVRALSDAIFEAHDIPAPANEALFCQCDVLKAIVAMLRDRNQMIKEIHAQVIEIQL